MDTTNVFDGTLHPASESQNNSRIASVDFSYDLEHNLGRANGNSFQRVPGIENVHDGQMMVRLQKKRFIVIDYSIIPNPADVVAAQSNPHVQIPPGAGVQKCATVNCNKIGTPVCIFDSEPDEPTSLYVRSGLCFTCQRALNEKRRSKNKRKTDVSKEQDVSNVTAMSGQTLKRCRIQGEIIDLNADAIIINGPPVDHVSSRGRGYEYDKIIIDIDKSNTDLLKKTMDLSRMMIIYGQQGTLFNHYKEIEDLYQSAFSSASKSIYLLNQWKNSFDDAIHANSPNVVEASDAGASAAAIPMPPLPKVFKDDQSL